MTTCLAEDECGFILASGSRDCNIALWKKSAISSEVILCSIIFSTAHWYIIDYSNISLVSRTYEYANYWATFISYKFFITYDALEADYSISA